MNQKTMKLSPIVWFLLILVSLSGCAIANLQTANTKRPGEGSFFVAGTVPMDADGFIPEIGARFGLSENMDAGIRLFALGFFGDFKLALFQSRKEGPSLALNGGIGYCQISDFSLMILDIGAIFSISLNGITPYVAAKYRNYKAGENYTSEDFSFSGEFIIGTIGIELFSQSSVSLLLEANRLFSTEGDEASDMVFSGGIKFNF